jgi:hypothetical protein
MKNKFAATSWMNALASGNGISGNANELLKLTAEREEENLKNADRRFIDFN